MAARPGGRILTILLLALVATTASADKTVYRWVDADGVIHFSDSPPGDSATADVETMTVPQAPAVTAVPAAPTERPQPPSMTPAAEPRPVVQPAFQALELSEMSLADLDLRCDDARERKIAPLRQAAIEECQANRRNDPEWCVRFNADFGDGGRTVNGTIRPRMFDDLPECVDALQERNRRRR